MGVVYYQLETFLSSSKRQNSKILTAAVQLPSCARDYRRANAVAQLGTSCACALDRGTHTLVGLLVYCASSSRPEMLTQHKIWVFGCVGE